MLLTIFFPVAAFPWAKNIGTASGDIYALKYNGLG